MDITPIDFWLWKVHCGDCIGLMRQIPAKSLKLIITSPPYNIRKSTGGGFHHGGNGKWEKAQLLKGYEIVDGENAYGDDMPHKDYVHWQRSCLREMVRLLRDDGAIFYNHKWRVQNGLLQDRTDLMTGFPVRQIIIWKRKGGINFNPGYFLPTYEVVYLIAKDRFRLEPRANAVGDVWEIAQERNNPHPAPFPLALVERCMGSVGPGIVLDPFVGSGTVAIAAENSGRPWIGMDISRKYCKMASDRIQANRERHNP